jgi:nucleotidyltransferase/DNA polymerase involved in DNA repair
MKIETAEQLLKLPLPLLVQSVRSKRYTQPGIDRVMTQFGERLANVLFKACRGLDHESLEPSSERTKSMSEEDSFVSCTDLDDAKQRIRSLLVDLLHRYDICAFLCVHEKVRH